MFSFVFLEPFLKRRFFLCIFRGVLVCTDVLSRGIDVADVDWVIQFDLPSNASAFVHRCGRTARLERVGNAIVFLLPNEDAYVNFIKINQIPDFISLLAIKFSFFFIRQLILIPFILIFFLV